MAPKMIPMPSARPISYALRNEMVITETSEDDCIKVVATTPKLRLFRRRSVLASTPAARCPRCRP